MEADHDMLEVHTSPELELIALDAELDALEEMDNIDQLAVLIKEINIIMTHSLTPTEGWYEERVNYIHIYNDLNWDYLIHEFRNHDRFMYETSMRLKSTMGIILDQWQKGLFSLQHYQFVIYNVHNIWSYYKSNFVTSAKMDDLSAAMSQL